MIFLSFGRVGSSLRHAYLTTKVNLCMNQILMLRSLHHEFKCKSLITHWRQYSNLAVSHPRLYKLHKQQRISDNLSEDWDLIFAPNRGLKAHWKGTVSYWGSFVGLCAIPFLGFYGWMEAELEERVDLFGIEMSSQTQFLIFIALQIVIVSNIFRYFHCIPRRVYYNEKSDKYLAVSYHILPWKLVRREFQSIDIQDSAGNKWMFRFNPLGHSEFKIHNKTFILPIDYFRSGHDRDWMLRYKNFKVREG